MKVSGLVFLIFAAFLAVAAAFPALDENNFESENSSSETEELGVRFRRVTCDLLSVSVPIGSLNHSACAAHCLAKRKGYRGGRCRDGVCHCRR